MVGTPNSKKPTTPAFRKADVKRNISETEKTHVASAGAKSIRSNTVMKKPKNILIFSDGTGQYGGLRPDQRLSNIYKMYRAMRPGPPNKISPADQFAFYDPGLGSGEGGGRLRNIIAAAFGTGISENIIDCYEAIMKSYRPGDRIFIFGFSRGAYTARCVANVLNLCGVPTQDGSGGRLPVGGIKLRSIAEEAVYRVYEHGSGKDREKFERQREELADRFRKRYGSAGSGTKGEAQGNVAPTFIGVFDTVAALGGVIVRRILTAIAVSAGLLGAASYYYDWPWWGKILAFAPAAFIITSLLWSVKKQFKYIWKPTGTRIPIRFHFAAWNLKNYDRYLDSSVGYARHAISIDENRARFPRVGWGMGTDVNEVNRGDIAWLKQEWFAGNHSDIGGSYLEEESRLSDIALKWMVDELKKIPVPPKMNSSFVQTYPDALGLQHDEVLLSRESWLPRWVPWRLGWKSEMRAINSKAVIHESVIQRLKAELVPQFDALKPYRPDGLRGHEVANRYFAER